MISKTKISIIITIFLSMGFGFSQEITKDKIIIDFSHYKEKCEDTDIAENLKVKKKEGLQFNFCGKAVF
ncbi:hypothetical protein U8527_09110 [Kordia algicida OT-1]|uniref:Uncharacterized protein n=1 Tax=Kordia algicida OT-1 TaxID=391587 RepID=A9DU71_9FLAO|nr:hypothetical protein [Kordia algicida]EDP96258.1 hypothetical protein KAOT1_02577 [Kordia algicida OT-1]